MHHRILLLCPSAGTEVHKVIEQQQGNTDHKQEKSSQFGMASDLPEYSQ